MEISSIYLDYAATTPVHPRVARVMSENLLNPIAFGNASSNTHEFGYLSQNAIKTARDNLANLLNCKSRELVFTSGATESNNIIIQSVLNHLTQEQEAIHVITSSLEHKSVLDTFKHLEENYNVNVTYLKPDKEGNITLEVLSDAFCENTRFVSLMHVNNELGNITDIKACAEFCHDHGALFHTDASQGAFKLDISLKDTKIDFLSMSGHKIYGPKGVGLIYVAQRSKQYLSSISKGGDQERGLRPGTLANHQIVGLSEAASVTHENMGNTLEKVTLLRNIVLSTLDEKGIDYSVNSHLNGYPGILNLCLHGVESDTLVMMASDVVALSTGSACNSKAKDDSYVLRALYSDKPKEGAHIRLSFGFFSTPKEVLNAINHIANVVEKIKEM